MMHRRALVFACAALLLSTRILHSQQREGWHSSCAATPESQGYLRAFAKYFRDDDMAAVRGDRIAQISPTDRQGVVTRIGTCEAVRKAAVRRLRQYEPGWPKIEAAGYDVVVLRYGPYYAILVKNAIDPDTGRRPHYVPLLVFRAHGLSYLRTILV